MLPRKNTSSKIPLWIPPHGAIRFSGMWFGFRPVVPNISKDSTFIFKGEATEKYFFLLNRVVGLKPHTCGI